jgi:hypothetical protein
MPNIRINGKIESPKHQLGNTFETLKYNRTYFEAAFFRENVNKNA